MLTTTPIGILDICKRTGGYNDFKTKQNMKRYIACQFYNDHYHFLLARYELQNDKYYFQSQIHMIVIFELLLLVIKKLHIYFLPLITLFLIKL